MKPASWLMAAVAAIGAGLTGGCLQLDANLKVQPDGSGELCLVYAMRKPILAQLQTMRTLGVQLDLAGSGSGAKAVPEDLDPPVQFDEAAIRNKFKGYEAQGITLKTLEIKTRNEWQVADMAIGFRSLEKLVNLPCFRDCAFTLKREKDNNCRFVLQGPLLGVGGTFPDMADEPVVRNLTPLLTGLNIMVRVSVPGDILASNAALSDGRRATWEYDYDRDAKGLEKFASAERARMVVVFSGAEAALRDLVKPAAGSSSAQ